jgi:hypothetical protein
MSIRNVQIGIDLLRNSVFAIDFVYENDLRNWSSELDGILNGYSYSVTAGRMVGLTLTAATGSGSAVGVGFVTPQVGSGVSYSYLIGHWGPKW